MSEQIRENIGNLSQYEPILPLIQNLQVKSFNYKKIVNTPAIEENVAELTGQVTQAQVESYISYPEGIQVMIDPASLESIYPEGVVTGENGTKYYRSEIVIAFLVQAVKEMYEELSKKIKALESK